MQCCQKFPLELLLFNKNYTGSTSVCVIMIASGCPSLHDLPYLSLYKLEVYTRGGGMWVPITWHEPFDAKG